MGVKRLDFILPLAIFISISTVYLVSISSGYHYDSIVLAQFAENNSLFIYGWRQHSFLILINTFFYRLWSYFYPGQNALFPLAILGCFVGSLGVVVFFLTLKALFSNRSLALFGALGLAFSINYWRYSVLVETHIIPTFLLLTAVYYIALLKNNESKVYLILSGIFAGLSVLSSGANIVFLPALLIFLFYTVSSKNRRTSFVVRFLVTFFCFWLIPYLLIGLILFLKGMIFEHKIYGSGAVKSLILWLRSELYIIPFKISNLIVIAEKNVSSVFTVSNKLVSILFIYTATFLLFISKWKDFVRNYLNIMLATFTAALLFFGTLLFYEPFNLQRYTPFLIFVWLFICVLLKDLFLKEERLYKRLIVFLLIISLFIYNFMFSIFPDTKPENNRSLKISLLIKEGTDKDDIIIERGGEVWSNGTIWPTAMTKYIPYFARRRLVTFLEIDTESRKTSQEVELLKLKKVIDQAINAGRKVLVFDNALDINAGSKRQTYPVIYSRLSSFIQTEYLITKYREKDNVVIYRLARRDI